MCVWWGGGRVKKRDSSPLDLLWVTPGPPHPISIFFFLNFYLYFILLYNTVLVLPYIDMNPPWVYMSSQS